MYICMYMFMYVCICMYVFMYVCMSDAVRQTPCCRLAAFDYMHTYTHRHHLRASQKCMYPQRGPVCIMIKRIFMTEYMYTYTHRHHLRASQKCMYPQRGAVCMQKRVRLRVYMRETRHDVWEEKLLCDNGMSV